MPVKKKQLVGKWIWLNHGMDNQNDPKYMEFQADGLYISTCINQGNLKGWDIGDWECLDQTKVRISTVHALNSIYQYYLMEDRLVFIAPDESRMEFQRVQ